MFKGNRLFQTNTVYGVRLGEVVFPTSKRFSYLQRFSFLVLLNKQFPLNERPFIFSHYATLYSDLAPLNGPNPSSAFRDTRSCSILMPFSPSA